MSRGGEAPKRTLANVRFWHKTDMPAALINVCFRS